MTRARLVVGNWKMNPSSVEDAVALALMVAAMPTRGVRIAVAPPSIALQAVSLALRDGDVAVFAQDVHWEEQGAYTGQVSAAMLRGNAEGSIVGHSEVRRDQGDDDDRVAKKLARVLSAGLRAILCVGESEAQFAAGETDAVLARQIARGVADAGRLDASRFVVAYEPIWAIGTGRPASAAHASAAAAVIRAALRVAGAHADEVAILYGGSVSAGSAAEFAGAAGIDGALVGGASLKVDELSAIARSFGS